MSDTQDLRIGGKYLIWIWHNEPPMARECTDADEDYWYLTSPGEDDQPWLVLRGTKVDGNMLIDISDPEKLLQDILAEKFALCPASKETVDGEVRHVCPCGRHEDGTPKTRKEREGSDG